MTFQKTHYDLRLEAYAVHLESKHLILFVCMLLEFQADCLPCTPSAIADIMLSQSQAKVLVGDPHQQIYGFRGAVNAMQQVTASKIFYLTQVRTAEVIGHYSTRHVHRSQVITLQGMCGSVQCPYMKNSLIVSNLTLDQRSMSNLTLSVLNHLQLLI